MKLPAAPAGKKVYLWLGTTDGAVKVFVNGKHVPYVDPKGEKADDVHRLLPAGVVRHHGGGAGRGTGSACSARGSG